MSTVERFNHTFGALRLKLCGGKSNVGEAGLLVAMEIGAKSGG
jgi:hypothetical protein